MLIATLDKHPCVQSSSLNLPGTDSAAELFSATLWRLASFNPTMIDEPLRLVSNTDASSYPVSLRIMASHAKQALVLVLGVIRCNDAEHPLHWEHAAQHRINKLLFS
jgi:hypothetical protein